MSPLEDLKEVDRHLYNQLTDLINEEGSESKLHIIVFSNPLTTPTCNPLTTPTCSDLDLTFSTTVLSPWCERGVACINIPLNEGGTEYLVTDTNKVSNNNIATLST